MLDFAKFGSDKDTLHSYRNFYENILDTRDSVDIFELGVHNGGSIQTYLSHPNTNSIVGCDIAPCSFTSPKYTFYNENFNTAIPKLVDTFDLLVDDGSHLKVDQMEFLKLVVPLTRNGGIVAIEDIDNPDQDIIDFLRICPDGWSCNVYDGRKITSRYDDVIIYYQKPT